MQRALLLAPMDLGESLSYLRHHLVDCLMGTLTVQRGQDLVGGLDPDEGLAVVVPVIDEALDGLDQSPDAGEGAAADGPPAEDREPRLHLVQIGRASCRGR